MIILFFLIWCSNYSFIEIWIYVGWTSPLKVLLSIYARKQSSRTIPKLINLIQKFQQLDFLPQACNHWDLGFISVHGSWGFYQKLFPSLLVKGKTKVSKALKNNINSTFILIKVNILLQLSVYKHVFTISGTPGKK